MRTRRGDRGVTAIEYALLVAAVAALLVFVVPALADAMTSRAAWVDRQTSGQP